LLVLVLTFDTSTPTVSVAVAELPPLDATPGLRVYPSDDYCRVLNEFNAAAPRRHGEVLALMLDSALRAADVTSGELAAIGVGLGPGPFTGLRVGVMTAAALADALDLPAYGECSLDVVAHDPEPGRSTDLLVVSDALRKQVYWARYSPAGQRLEGPELDTAAALRSRFLGTGARVVGPAVSKYLDDFAGLAATNVPSFPSAALIASRIAARARAHAPSDQLEPMYLRRPDARPPGSAKKVTPT
jgi:tRNA threonylcarbamoyl adenosine modification protein YeaZ